MTLHPAQRPLPLFLGSRGFTRESNNLHQFLE